MPSCVSGLHYNEISINVFRKRHALSPTSLRKIAASDDLMIALGEQDSSPCLQRFIHCAKALTWNTSAFSAITQRRDAWRERNLLKINLQTVATKIKALSRTVVENTTLFSANDESYFSKSGCLHLIHCSPKNGKRKVRWERHWITKLVTSHQRSRRFTKRRFLNAFKSFDCLLISE